MTEQTFSSLESLEKKARLAGGPDRGRREAIKHYFLRGGIVRVHLDSESQKQWPPLVYPTKLRIRALIKEKNSLKSNYSGKKRDWEKKLKDAEFYGLKHSVKKYSQPLYWKHKAKFARDSEYREDAEKVNLPLHLVADPRWQPMIRMFIEDLEYRKQLTETVENSIVYRKDKKLAKHATELQNFRKTESSRKIVELNKKIAEIDADINSYQALMDWSNE